MNLYKANLVWIHKWETHFYVAIFFSYVSYIAFLPLKLQKYHAWHEQWLTKWWFRTSTFNPGLKAN